MKKYKRLDLYIQGLLVRTTLYVVNSNLLTNLKEKRVLKLETIFGKQPIFPDVFFKFCAPLFCVCLMVTPS